MTIKTTSKILLTLVGLLASLLFGMQPVQADISYPTIAFNQFPGITLSSPLPKQFIINEYYSIKGTLTNTNLKSVSVLLQDEAGKIVLQDTFNTNEGKFEITLGLLESGKFYLNLSPGKLRSTTSAEIRVLPHTISVERADQKHTPPSNLRFFMDANQSFLSWKNRGTDNLNRLTFTQGPQILTIYIGNNSSKWEVDYILFKDFEEGEITWTIESAYSSDGGLVSRKTDWSRSATKKFVASQHHFAQVSSLLRLDRLEFEGRKNGALTLSGICLGEIDSTARIITPSGKIEELKLDPKNDLIASGTPFSFTYNFDEEGSFFIALINRNHLPVLNIPVYVGTTFPILPDPIDLANTTDKVNQNSQLSALKLLNLINRERAENKLQTLEFDENLNKMATSYAKEVAESGNFSHSSLDGKTANQRRLDFDVLTPVGENLAQAGSIEEAHYLLMRSATHRANILDPRWERAGIGISANSAGFFIITEEFSVRSVKNDPLSDTQIQSLQREILENINKKRSNQELASLSTDYSLQSTLETAFNFSKGDPDGTILRLSRSDVFNKIKGRLLSLSAKSYFTDLGKLFAGHESITDKVFHKIAIAIYQDEELDSLSTMILLER